MSFTPINHVHGVLHVIVDATGNNYSLITKAFLKFFPDLVGMCPAWNSRSRLHITLWSFFFFYSFIVTIFFFVTVTIYLERLRPIKLIKQKRNKTKLSLLFVVTATSSGFLYCT